MTIYIVMFQSIEGWDDIISIWHKHEHALEDAEARNKIMNTAYYGGEYVVLAYEVK